MKFPVPGRCRWVVHACLLLLLVAFCPVRLRAESAEPGVNTSNEALLRRLEEIEQELQALREAGVIQQTRGSQLYPPQNAVGRACLNEPCEGSGLGLAVEEREFPSVKVTGYMQIDTAWFNQSATNKATVGEAEDGADFRRARLAAAGDVAENVGYMIEFDFASPGRPSFMDVWLEIRDLPVLGNLRVGQWRQPFGMDALSSSRELAFIERNLSTAMAPARQIGIGFYDSNEETGSTWAASLFRFPTDPFGGNVGDSGGYSFAGRTTTLLWDDESTQSLFHVGMDYALINPSNHFSQFRSAPEIFVSEQPGALVVAHSIPFFVNTLPIPTHLYHVVNLESGFRRGSLSGQAEWRLAHVNQTGGPALNFQSAYGQVAYLLTGEVRPYNKSSGVFGRITPNRPFQAGCGTGAWETAARLSWIDLDDQNITGNQLVDVTLGLNWYLNRYTKFQFNYIHAYLSGTAIPDSHTNILAARAQVDF